MSTDNSLADRLAGEGRAGHEGAPMREETRASGENEQGEDGSTMPSEGILELVAAFLPELDL